jgi:uncharacterized protein (TIGR00297 family)
VAQIDRISHHELAWQSKLVLLIVMPAVAAGLVLQAHWWSVQYAAVSIWTSGISLLLGLVVLKLRAATLAGAATGAAITGSLMFSTTLVPYQPWRTALIPVLAVSLLAHVSTRLGRAHKERLGTAERLHGRSASQVAANLGLAALASNDLVQGWLTDTHWFARSTQAPMPLFTVALAALAEAAADTVSSEIGQVLGGRPTLITDGGRVDPGTEGAISLAGSLAGLAAAAIVSALGTLALHGDSAVFWISCGAGWLGMFFDSLLGATLERRGLLNNDLVNFLSTAGASGMALGLLAILSRLAGK